MKKRGPIDDLKCKYQMTAVTFNDTSDRVICAGIDNTVKIYDRRAQKVFFHLGKHIQNQNRDFSFFLGFC